MTIIKPCLNHSYVKLWAKYTPPFSLSSSPWRWARTSCWRFLPGRWRSQTLESRTYPETCPSLYPCATPSLNSLKLNCLTYHVKLAILLTYSYAFIKMWFNFFYTNINQFIRVTVIKLLFAYEKISRDSRNPFFLTANQSFHI